MTTQTIDTPIRTFASEASAKKAVKRDCAKLPAAVEIEDVEYRPTVIDEIARVMPCIVFADDVPRELLAPLEGYQIDFRETHEVADDAPKKERKARAPFFRTVGNADDLQKVRAGTKRAELLSVLVNGATYDEIAALCIKADGSPWSKAAIRSACTSFFPNLGGYGAKEVIGDDGASTFYVLLPDGTTLADCLRG